QDIIGELAHDRVYHLWNSVRPWVLMQLGVIQTKQTKPESSFDMQEIFSHLVRKIEHTSKVSEPYNPPFDEIRYGLMVDSHSIEDYSGPIHRWYIFERTPYSDDLVAGCLVINEGKETSTAIIPLDEQAEKAEQCVSSKIARPILVGKSFGINILYFDTDGLAYSSPEGIVYADVEWQARGHLRYGTRQIGALAQLKWLSTSYYAQFPVPDTNRLPRRHPDLPQKMFKYLETIATKLSTVHRVRCKVEGTSKKGVIKFETSNGKSVGELGYIDEQRAVNILRGPYEIGIPLGINRSLLTWHPVTDISYSKDTSELRSGIVKYIADR
ncbi:hypothetical protein KA005_53955, partial [bacterium]|nr:hypothetical protein [bacterium]